MQDIKLQIQEAQWAPNKISSGNSKPTHIITYSMERQRILKAREKQCIKYKGLYFSDCEFLMRNQRPEDSRTFLKCWEKGGIKPVNPEFYIL